jgi:hypothetical protein
VYKEARALKARRAAQVVPSIIERVPLSTMSQMSPLSPLSPLSPMSLELAEESE